MKTSQDALEMIDLSIGGMTCAACAARLEKQLNRLPGVEAAVNFAAERAHIRFPRDALDTATLLATVVKTGFSAAVARDDTRETEKARKLAVYRQEMVQFGYAAALTLPLVAQMFFMFVGDRHEDVIPRWLQLLLATPVQFWIGARFYRGAWNALRNICEKYLSDDSGGLMDYKVLCCDGEPAVLWVDVDRYAGHKRAFFSVRWEPIDVTFNKYPQFTGRIERPGNLEEMLALSRELARGFPFARIDFYSLSGRTVFGEVTFHPASGFAEFSSPEFSASLAELIPTSGGGAR